MPRKFAIYLLWLYIFMGVVSLIAGALLGYTAYQARMDGVRHGPIYLMIVGGVIAAFGVWRCGLAFYHLRRIRVGAKRQ